MLNKAEKENLREFISDVYGDSISNDDFYFIGNKEYMNIKRANDLEKILQDFITNLDNQKDCLYFTNQTFYWYVEKGKPRRKQKNVKSIKTFYIDIDHIEVNHLETKEDVKKYLFNNYPFLEEIGIFPQYILLSGNGLHLYFVLKEPFNFVTLDDKEKQIKVNNIRKNKWKELSLMMCSLFNSDSRVSSDISKILRVPYSYNLKDKGKPIRTKFFNFKDEYPCMSYSDLKAQIEPLISLDDKKNNDKINKEIRANNNKEYEEKEYTYNENTIKEIQSYYANYKESRRYNRTFENIIYFLEEILLPHRNYDIEGYRHSFIFCIAKIYQNNKRTYEETLEHCIELNLKLINPLDYKEITDSIYYIFDPSNKVTINDKQVLKCCVKLSNESIRKMLQITPEEQNLCHKTSFYKEHKILKEKIKDDIKNNKNKKNKDELYFQILEQNPNATIKELMELMSLSKRQVYNIKKKYNEYLDKFKSLIIGSFFIIKTLYPVVVKLCKILKQFNFRTNFKHYI